MGGGVAEGMWEHMETLGLFSVCDQGVPSQLSQAEAAVWEKVCSSWEERQHPLAYLLPVVL